MSKDRVSETLVEALKQALAEPGEQRLYKSGKLAGLFPGRTGAGGDAAARALREELLEVVRTETKGKTVIDWVRITPRGVEYLHGQESPLRTLEELRETLRLNQQAVPVWLAEMREESQRWLHRLDALAQRVDEALRRLDVGPALPDGLAAVVPWANDALAYLDRRRGSGAATDCPLPELFAALTAAHAGLSVTAFHDGLRRLHERRALRLLPVAAPAGELPQPEFALFDGSAVYWFAAR